MDKQLREFGIVRDRLGGAAGLHPLIAVKLWDNPCWLSFRINHLALAFNTPIYGWIEAHHPRAPDEWTRLFRQNFRFTGGLIVGEFLMSLGYLPGAHQPHCPVYPRILALAPPWARPAAGAPAGKIDGGAKSGPILA